MSADELAKLLDELGRRLGPAGEHVFQIAVQRIVIQSLINTIVGTFALLVIGWGLIRISRFLWVVTAPKPDRYSSDDAFDRYFPIGILWLIGGIPFCLSLIAVTAAVTDLLTAEFVALRTLLGAIIK